jgi:hypothetical protein
MIATGGITNTYTQTTTRTNLIANPSFEVDLFGWTGPQSDATISRVTSESYVGSACVKMDTTSSYQAMGSPAGSSSIYTVLPSTTYSFSVWAKSTTNSSLLVAVNEYTSSGGYISAGFSGSITQLDSTWKRVSVIGTTTSTTGKVQLAVFCTSSGVHTTYVDAMLLEKSSSVGEYFDGSYPSSSWSGTAHASSSIFSESFTYKSHTFSTDPGETYYSSFDVSSIGVSPYGSTVEYMVIAGGGAGGDSGGGGGAGGAIVGTTTVAAESYAIKVGIGGSPQYETGNAGNNGSSSYFGAIVATGGGGGGGQNSGQLSGINGGSGGGASASLGPMQTGSPGAGVAGQGFSGGTADYDEIGARSGGGGGASGPGYYGQYWYYSPEWGGFWVNAKLGGPGIQNSFVDGTTRYYAGGGMPVAQEAIPTSIYGGGGTQGAPNYGGISGTNATGSGGGSGYGYPGRGATGIVVIRYRIA